MPTRVRASDLYDLAECAHRLTLDRRLPREQRAKPDAGLQALLDAGLALEARVARELGYPEPTYPLGEFETGAARTEVFMQTGAEGVYQGVLLFEDYLAIPDLMEKREGTSAFGDWHYVPGDVKAGLDPRADQVLQVAFAGWMLGKLQGRAPTEGFLILGDGRRETFSLTRIARIFEAALARATRIAKGEEETEPFFDGELCGRCRWSGACLPGMLEAQDLSLVDGMTRARRRVLTGYGVTTVSGLAELEPASWRAQGRPTLGLETMAHQARALISGVAKKLRAFPMPETREGAHFVHVEADPLREGEPGLLAWHTPREEPEVRVLLDTDQSIEALCGLFDALDRAPGPVFHFGSGASRGLARLCGTAGIDPDAQVRLEQRLSNLGAILRRGTAFLPVRRYGIDEVSAAIAGEPLPAPDELPEPAFLHLQALRQGAAEQRTPPLVALGERRLAQLRAIAAWMGAAP